MIPDFIDIGATWRVLPPGIHGATLEEIELRFAGSLQRRRLFMGLIEGITALRMANCSEIYLDGSFVTEKEIPGDYDACWNPIGVDDKKLDPVFLDFTNGRKTQKLKFLGEYFPSSATETSSGFSFLEYFQIEKDTKKAKGIIRILN